VLISLRSLGSLVLQLLGALAVLILVMLALVLLREQSIFAGPQAQGAPGRGPFGTTEQNNCTAYMESQGYHVDAVGRPRLSNGTPDPDTVVMLMPVQSPQFDPDASLAGDEESSRQVLEGFRVCYRFYNDISTVGIGLEWGPYIIMVPASAADWQAVEDGRMTPDELWRKTQPQITILNASTLRPISETDFTQKNFTGYKDVQQSMPPQTDPTPTRSESVKLQPSTAYLPVGSSLTLVAGTYDRGFRVLPAKEISFTYQVRGQDPVDLARNTSDANGTARVTLPGASVQAGDQIIVRAAMDSSGAVASSPVQVGPAVSGPAALDAISQSLKLQGYNVLNVEYRPASGSAPARAGALAEIASSRLDRSVRLQLLTMIGTLFAVYPDVQVAHPAVIYRSQATPFQLVFNVSRADWDAWLAGTISEAQLWQRIRLDPVRDVRTGHPAGQRDFLNKNFTGDTGRAMDLQTPQAVRSTVTRESWGDQLNPAKFKVPVGGYANSFQVVERSDSAEFAIYSAVDPTTPLYSSTEDPDGSRLRLLRLAPGQYILSIESSQVPSAIGLTYFVHLAATSTQNP
jgi:hypothetical protein